jgi:Asp-tRNA(Asn)/Glu-tRNA(Gln) amidotransferase B subunit
MARRLARAPWAGLFDEVAPEAGEAARRLAGVLEKRIPYHARRRGHPRRPDWGETPEELLPDVNRIAPLVRAVERGKLRPEALVWAVDDVLEEAGRTTSEILSGYRPVQADSPRAKKVVGAVAEKAQALSGRPPDVLMRWAMGEAMRELLGQMDPREIRKQLALALGVAEEDAS